MHGNREHEKSCRFRRNVWSDRHFLHVRVAQSAPGIAIDTVAHRTRHSPQVPSFGNAPAHSRRVVVISDGMRSNGREPLRSSTVKAGSTSSGRRPGQVRPGRAATHCRRGRPGVLNLVGITESNLQLAIAAERPAQPVAAIRQRHTGRVDDALRRRTAGHHILRTNESQQRRQQQACTAAQ